MKRSSLGSITALGKDHWRVRVSAGRDSDGRRAWLSENVRGPRKDAELARARLLLKAGRGANAMKRASVYEYVSEAWLPTRTELRESTRSEYERIVATHIRRHFDTVRLDGVLAYTITQRLALIEAPGARLKVYSLLRTAMRHAVRSGFLDVDPMPAVERPKPSRKDAEAQTLDVYSLTEAQDLLDYFRGDRIEAAVILGVFAGLRRSEIAALDWQDLSLPKDGAGEVVVRRGYHGSEVFEAPKSARSRRTVVLPSVAVARLREIRGRLDLIGPLLSDGSGRRMEPEAITRRWRRMMGATSGHTPPVRYLPLKNLRHTHATIALRSGMDVVDVSRRLGHSSVTVTDAFYLRPGRESDVALADTLDIAFGHKKSQRRA